MLVLDLWYQTHNEYAIITHYPKPADSMERDMPRWFKLSPGGHPQSYHICGSLWETPPNHMPRNANGCYLSVKKRLDLESVLVPFWAAGFSFAKAHLRENVKWDPHTQYIFNGEEFHFATRAWTHGYDFYSPPFDIACSCSLHSFPHLHACLCPLALLLCVVSGLLLYPNAEWNGFVKAHCVLCVFHHSPSVF